MAREIELSEIDRETLNSYLATYDLMTDALERYDARIEELSYMDEYREKVQKLRCFVGIKTHTALSLIVETGDFSRFVRKLLRLFRRTGSWRRLKRPSHKQMPYHESRKQAFAYTSYRVRSGNRPQPSRI